MPRKSVSEKPLIVSTGSAAAPARRKSSTPKRVSHSVEPPAAVAVEAVALEPSQDAIAKLAHSYWEGRGRQGGSAEEDWLRAERELRAEAK